MIADASLELWTGIDRRRLDLRRLLQLLHELCKELKSLRREFLGVDEAIDLESCSGRQIWRYQPFDLSPRYRPPLRVWLCHQRFLPRNQSRMEPDCDRSITN